MSSYADQPNAADARRAAALIIHRRRADTAGVEALLSEADSAGRITELVLAVLHLYSQVIKELRSDSGVKLIAFYVRHVREVAEQAGPEAGVGEMAQSTRLLDAHASGDIVGISEAFREAAAADRAVYLIFGLLDLFEGLVPELSCEAGFDWLHRCVATFAAEEVQDDGKS